MRLVVTFIIVFSGIAQVQAQLGGESTYQFLNLMSSPRQAALEAKCLLMSIMTSPKGCITLQP